MRPSSFASSLVFTSASALVFTSFEATSSIFFLSSSAFAFFSASLALSKATESSLIFFSDAATCFFLSSRTLADTFFFCSSDFACLSRTHLLLLSNFNLPSLIFHTLIFSFPSTAAINLKSSAIEISFIPAPLLISLVLLILVPSTFQNLMMLSLPNETISFPPLP